MIARGDDHDLDAAVGAAYGWPRISPMRTRWRSCLNLILRELGRQTYFSAKAKTMTMSIPRLGRIMDIGHQLIGIRGDEVATDVA
jgi:hypothetical protein